jgi:hypothetical protein
MAQRVFDGLSLKPAFALSVGKVDDDSNRMPA